MTVGSEQPLVAGAFQAELDQLSTYGPGGRIAVVRQRLGMRQVDFGRAVGVGRETVSHWENLDSNGKPRQRTTPRSASAIAALVRERLGVAVLEDTFLGRAESPLDVLVRQQVALEEQVARVVQGQRRISARLDDVLDMLSIVTGRPSPEGRPQAHLGATADS